MGESNDIKETDRSEIKPLEEIDPDNSPLEALDEREMPEPQKEIQDETEDPQQENVSDPADDEQADNLDAMDGQADDNADSGETDAQLDQTDSQPNSQLQSDDPNAQDTEPEVTQADNEDISDETLAVDEPAADGEPAQIEEPTEGDSESAEVKDEGVVEAAPPNDQDLAEVKDSQTDSDDNGFVSLNDEEVDHDPSEEETSVSGKEKQEVVEEDKSENNPTVDKSTDDIKLADQKESDPKDIKNRPKGEKTVNGFSASKKKLVVSALIVLIISGFIVYSKPSFWGPKEEEKSIPAAASEKKEPAKAAEIQVQEPKPAGQNDKYLVKLEEADRLREQLLAKKEEIFKLKLHYRNGIAELENQIGREMREANITAFSQAIANKRIELNLRTIQRREAYIQELDKPDRWVHSGSEELLFLMRKARLDLQMVDIASGIDLNRHMRYLNAAIQKYQPSAEKLAVNSSTTKLKPLETIWSEINNHQINRASSSLGKKDQEIFEEICSGNFKRITELSAINAKAARCLSKNSGADLFLNGLTQLSPNAAKYLFQWQGNWICLNSVKKLSPAVASYMFKWEGNWISLNGLTEFPPELALFLMEWKGNQIELMGLKYDEEKSDPRALKYLALWESMGGKLYVPEGVRNE
jgi:hypothetical protein